MKRYQLLTNWSSADYREILAEIKENLCGDEAKATKKIRNNKKRAS